ncbi:hypothetical protein NUW58_g6663 [Xylaria curta]|uniref:Uncharacterized protein n=1 Tax=Xylaria curta TaxID=42375 RepID=A0ACC1NSJ3_9PEZI|nr:hypothetical protein NUW58_g6663 [Xylaria curta]
MPATKHQRRAMAFSKAKTSQQHASSSISNFARVSKTAGNVNMKKEASPSTPKKDVKLEPITPASRKRKPALRCFFSQKVGINEYINNPNNFPGADTMEERKINVELTAGGGGNTEYRRERIRAKNEKLNEERARRAQEEARVRDKKEREKAAKNAGGDKADAEEKEGGAHAVHPSRRRRVHGSA